MAFCMSGRAQSRTQTQRRGSKGDFISEIKSERILKQSDNKKKAMKQLPNVSYETYSK